MARQLMEIPAACMGALRQLGIGSIERLVCGFTRSPVEVVKGMHLVYTETVRISSVKCLANASATLLSYRRHDRPISFFYIAVSLWRSLAIAWQYQRSLNANWTHAGLAHHICGKSSSPSSVS